MKKKLLLIVCLNVVLAVLFSFASCAKQTAGQTDNGAGSAETDISTKDPGKTNPDDGEVSGKPADTSSPTEDVPIDYGEKKITEENGKKILTYGYLKIIASKNETTGEISGDAVYRPEGSGAWNYSFVVKQGHNKGNLPMDYYAYVEEMLGIVIDNVTFDDEIQFENALGSKTNNLLNVYINPTGMKNYTIKDGVVFTKESNKLVYFPAGRTGEYTVPDGTVEIVEGAFAGTKLTKLILPSSVVKYDAALNDIPTLTVEKKS